MAASRSVVMIGATIGSIVGGYVPVLFGADVFDLWSILFGMIGGFAGIALTVWLSKRLGW